MNRLNIYQILLLVLCLTTSTVGAQVPAGKSLSVPKLPVETALSAESIPALMDRYEVAFQPLDVVNWPSFPYRPEVSFRIAHTGHAFLLHYRVKETDVRAVAHNDNGKVWEDACVEFFVSPECNDHYYNFECNCIGRLLIQGGKADERRPLATAETLQLVKRWSSLGSDPFGLRKGECSWELTLIIPVSAFFQHALTSLDGSTLRANFYKCGDKLPTPHFLSWSPIALERPLFHCPTFFGTLHCQ